MAIRFQSGAMRFQSGADLTASRRADLTASRRADLTASRRADLSGLIVKTQEYRVLERSRNG